MIKKIENILKSTLMISVKNLADVLQTDSSQLLDALYLLENTGKLRIAYGKSCNTGCSSCADSCDSISTKKTITDTTIIISHIQNRDTLNF
jgi:hypothetical protein